MLQSVKVSCLLSNNTPFEFLLHSMGKIWDLETSVGKKLFSKNIEDQNWLMKSLLGSV